MTNSQRERRLSKVPTEARTLGASHDELRSEPKAYWLEADLDCKRKRATTVREVGTGVEADENGLVILPKSVASRKSPACTPHTQGAMRAYALDHWTPYEGIVA